MSFVAFQRKQRVSRNPLTFSISSSYKSPSCSHSRLHNVIPETAEWNVVGQEKPSRRPQEAFFQGEDGLGNKSEFRVRSRNCSDVRCIEHVNEDRSIK